MTLKNASKWMTTLSLSLVLAACGGGGNSSEGSSDSGNFDTSQNIHVVSREEGSGTRDAFVDSVGLTDDQGNDQTYAGATIQNSTNGVTQAVSNDESAIGYISLGSLDDSVTALNVNDVEPTNETVSSGEYEISRNFNVMHSSELSEAAQDFWDFIMSQQGQSIVEENGYVAVDSEAPEYEAGDVDGTISINGSTSAEPVIQALSDAYSELNPNATFEISATGSSAGVQAAIDGTADIGMASREVTSEEEEQLNNVAPFAIDGVAVVVNNSNSVENISMDNLRGVYSGDVTTWDQVAQ